MITRFTATKEEAERTLAALLRNAGRINQSDLDIIYNFVKAAKGRLPRHDTVARHSHRTRRTT